MAYLEWHNNQMHVLIPAEGAREAFHRLDLADDPVLATLLSQATGVKFEISGLLGTLGMTGSANPQIQTLTASLPVEEARDLARWILENID